MKKTVVSGMLASSVLLFSGAVPAFADQGQGSAPAQKNALAPATFHVVVEDRLVPGNWGAYINRDGRTLVPAVVLRWLGCSVSYDAKTGLISVTRGQDTFVLQNGSKVAQVNGNSDQMDTALEIKGGHAYFPLRYFADKLGYTIHWDGSSDAAVIDPSAATLAERQKIADLLTNSQTVSSQVYNETMTGTGSMKLGSANGKINMYMPMDITAYVNKNPMALYETVTTKLPNSQSVAQTVYEANNKMYIQISGKWYSMSMPVGQMQNQYTFSPSLLKSMLPYMKLTNATDGSGDSILTMDLDEVGFGQLLRSASSNPIFSSMQSQNLNAIDSVTGTFAFDYGKDGLTKSMNMELDMGMNANGQSVNMVMMMNFAFSNYNQTQTVVVPQDIINSAIPIPAQGTR